MRTRLICVFGVLLAMCTGSPAPAAPSLGYRVVAEALVPESQSRYAVLHANVAHPRALAVRLWARRNGRELRGQVTVRVICGQWKRITVVRGATPFVKPVPYRPGAGLCWVDASAMEVKQNSHAYLHLVLLAR